MNHTTNTSTTNAANFATTAGDAAKLSLDTKEIVKQLYMIQQTYFEPDEEDEDGEGNEEFSYLFVSATTREDALAPLVKDLLAKDFRAADKEDGGHAGTSHWTDDWTEVTLVVCSVEDEGFWKYLEWDFQDVIDQLVALASEQGLLAAKLLDSAKAGNSPGHQALAQNAKFLSAVEQYQLCGAVKLGKTTKAAKKPKSL